MPFLPPNQQRQSTEGHSQINRQPENTLSPATSRTDRDIRNLTRQGISIRKPKPELHRHDTLTLHQEVYQVLTTTGQERAVCDLDLVTYMWWMTDPHLLTYWPAFGLLSQPLLQLGLPFLRLLASRALLLLAVLAITFSLDAMSLAFQTLQSLSTMQQPATQ